MAGVQICTSLKVTYDPCMGSDAPAKQLQTDQGIHDCLHQSRMTDIHSVINANLCHHTKAVLKGS